MFTLAKDIVRKHLKIDRTGLMLGLANLGGGLGGLVGGFYQVAGNVIVLNTLPLRRLKETAPELHNAYAFHVLLHEYLHGLGYLTEQEVRPMVEELATKEFGPHHPVTQFAQGWTKFFPNLVYPVYGWNPPGGFDLEIVRGFDHEATDYIQ